jgi:hypothetical protein
MNIKTERRNIFSALFFVVLGLLLRFIIIPWGVPVRASWGGSVGVDSRTFPNFAASVITLAALIQMGISIKRYVTSRKSHASVSDTTTCNLRGEFRSLLVFLLFLVYAVLFRHVGFILASIFVPPAILFVMGSRKLIHYLSIYTFIAIIYAVFQFVLKVRLP